MSTLTPLRATSSISDSSDSITRLRVTISRRHGADFPWVPVGPSASLTTATSCPLSNGLVRNANAPSRVAVTASGIVPCAVRMMTGSAGIRSRSVLNSSSPSMPSIRRSVTTRSGISLAMCPSAARAPSTVTTSKPADSRRRHSKRRREGSSSTINTRQRLCDRRSF
jgi:hypothetical protein